MLYTKDEVIEYVEQEDIKFIRLAFCDLFGNQKNVSIMASELQRAFEHGISIDASAIRGFGDEAKSDLFLVPDSTSLQLLPWRPSHGRVARLFCDIKRPGGAPFELDARYILKLADSAARQHSVTIRFGAEFEFYLFKTDENGEPTNIPHDTAGYLDIAPEDKGENVRREICLTLEEMGISPECSHHEEGPGQHEIDFRYGEALLSADNATTFKAVVKTIAHRNGLHACFDPKPLEGESGNGFHVNISIESADGNDYTQYFMAGIFKHIKEMTLFLNPQEQSYKRLGKMKAPKYITWSPENRSQLIRIPAEKREFRRLELRSPDPVANPYIVYALLIHAGLDGIKNKLCAPEPVNINLYKAETAVTKDLERLPRNLSEAFSVAEKSPFIESVLKRQIVEAYGQLV